MVSAWIPRVLEIIAKCGPIVECVLSLKSEYHRTPVTQESVI